LKSQLYEIAHRLMRCPAAPYHESFVAGEALRICREHALSYEIDSFGNILIAAEQSRKSPPLVLAAHLDHPGFVIREQLSSRSWCAEFLGGVSDDHFRAGVPLKLHPGAISARLGTRLQRTKRLFEVRAASSPSIKPTFAVWDLPDFRLDRGRITGRSCDDLIGAATILHVLVELSRAKAKVPVVGVLSRAEEVGFHGALALAKS
jgi:putative aminopeptidase FrvX